VEEKGERKFQIIVVGFPKLILPAGKNLRATARDELTGSRTRPLNDYLLRSITLLDRTDWNIDLMPCRSNCGTHARGAPRASRETLRYAVVSVALLACVSDAFTQQHHSILMFAKSRTSASQPSIAIARSSVASPLFPRTLTTARSAVVPDLGSNLANDGADSEDLIGKPQSLSPDTEDHLDEPVESSAACVQQVLDNAVAFVEMPAWNLSSAPAFDDTTAPSHEDELNKSVATFAAMPASDSTADGQASSSSSSSPVGWDIVKMTLPLLAVWLSSPVLSVVDTAVVGRTAGMAELAALGPATALCDMGTYFFNFLSLVTTSRVAHALVAKDKQAAQKAVGDGVAVATVRPHARSPQELVGLMMLTRAKTLGFG